MKLWDATHGRLTKDDLTCVVFIDDDHLVAGGKGGNLELLDLSGPVRTTDEIMRLAATASKWHLVDGRAIERSPILQR